MFSSWVKRSSLKRKSSRPVLILPPPTGSNLVLLLSLMGLFVAMGVFVLQQTYAAGTIFGK